MGFNLRGRLTRTFSPRLGTTGVDKKLPTDRWVPPLSNSIKGVSKLYQTFISKCVLICLWYTLIQFDMRIKTISNDIKHSLIWFDMAYQKDIKLISNSYQNGAEREMSSFPIVFAAVLIWVLIWYQKRIKDLIWLWYCFDTTRGRSDRGHGPYQTSFWYNYQSISNYIKAYQTYQTRFLI